MSRIPRRTHSAAFKAKVALAAVRGDKTLAELAKAADVFGGEPRPDEPTIDLKVLHAKIGQLALENDFLEGALIKAGMLSAKR